MSIRRTRRPRSGFAPVLLRAAVVVSLTSLGAAALPTPVLAADAVLWDGGVETGGLPAGSITGGGTTDSAFSSIQQQGGAGLSSIVTERTRTADSTRSLKIVMPPFTQREQPSSSYSWYPDANGTVDHWYGFSIFYDSDWNLGGGIANEISGSNWHNPIAWRMQGDNGSLNVSGDLVDGKPHLMLRRNTVKDKEGFYTDGLGLDKIDMGPVVVGKWMDFVVHIRWSTTSKNALREVWRDGVYMGGSTSLNAVGTAKHVLRIGQYQKTNIGHTRTSFYDNVRIGTSYAAVDPARSDAVPTRQARQTTTTPTVEAPVLHGKFRKSLQTPKMRATRTRR